MTTLSQKVKTEKCCLCLSFIKACILMSYSFFLYFFFFCRRTCGQRVSVWRSGLVSLKYQTQRHVWKSRIQGPPKAGFSVVMETESPTGNIPTQWVWSRCEAHRAVHHASFMHLYGSVWLLQAQEMETEVQSMGSTAWYSISSDGKASLKHYCPCFSTHSCIWMRSLFQGM